jgi:cob(I)alamin adenosyltransferase
MEGDRMSDRPRILIFTGDGKGKTTAALGMAFRAAGHAMRSCIVQFIKSDLSVGEIAAAGVNEFIEIHATGLGFVPPSTDARFERHRAAAQAGLQQAFNAVASGRYAVVILDEICPAVANGLVESSQVLDLMDRAAAETCLVLTGRNAPTELIDRADTVTEMRCVKHDYHAGRPAQKGVER